MTNRDRVAGIESKLKENIANYLKGNKIAIKTQHYSKAQESQIEAELNRLWNARCKANDELLDFIHSKVMGYGYTFTFDSNADKQLKIIKEVSNV